MLGEGVTVGADNAIDTRGAYLPRCGIARPRDRVLVPPAPTPVRDRMATIPSSPARQATMAASRRRRRDRDTHGRGALARGDRPGRPLRPARRRARAARAPARRAVARGVGDHAGLGHAAGLVVAGMGGSAIGGALARAALGDHASRPIFVTARYGMPTVDDAGHDGAVRELLGRDRGDARLLRVRRRARRASARSSPPAGAWPRWRAPTACR